MLNTRILKPADEAHSTPLLIKNLLLTGQRYERTQEIIYRDLVRYDYRTFNERVCRAADALTKAGVKAGDTVAMMDWAFTTESSVTFQNTVLFAPRSARPVQIPTSNLYGVFNNDEEDALAHIARLENCLPTVQIRRLSGHLHAQNNLHCEQAADTVRLLRSLLIDS